ncbi:hypothetical protein B0I35DRAFT_478593 [Stachybotrys elegans]|uniref:Phytocyanin domain-containing protein n=1 Tax=Stachybotrys elegans TaxID=80388 RepID=A0A8K0WRH7_9HYPO|nr:hypothetical protein B0I35DRAFT_478593 [Stachybotrys elegans]
MAILTISTAILLGLSGALAEHFNVNVGKGGELRFDPEHIQAAPGDTITYHFFSRNHAVAESNFDHPCQYTEGGIFSGFVPTASESDPDPTTFTVTVHDEEPVWLYCPQLNGGHCQKGMVHAINPPDSGDRNLHAYRERASSAPNSTVPADGRPYGGERVVHVQVGVDGEFVFSPNEFNATTGTFVEFAFNPKNHTVTQSSFDKPCVPLENGFHSGFVPTEDSPSDVKFKIEIANDHPVWFYCAQGNHCKQGMVGSINAPVQGDKTFDAFRRLASHVESPSIPGPVAGQGGELEGGKTQHPTPPSGNEENGGEGQQPPSGNPPSGNPPADNPPSDNPPADNPPAGNDDEQDLGDSQNPPTWAGWEQDYLNTIPKPGEADNNQHLVDMAGGGAIAAYGWPDSITDSAVKYLQLLNWFDNIILELLMAGYQRLHSGDWQGAYPRTIVDAIGAMAAQGYMIRTAATDSLQHYNKPTMELCKYNLDLANVDDFLGKVLYAVLMEIGLLLDLAAKFAETDRWLVPVTASSLGVRARMAAVINLMQNHPAAASPREAYLPAEFVYSYTRQHYISICGTGEDGWAEPWAEPLPNLEIDRTDKSNHGKHRVTNIYLKLEDSWARDRDLWVAYMGPWGSVRYSPVDDAGKSEVPANLWGHVWIVLTHKRDVPITDLYGASVAGPQLLWIG